jgi:hypothetical protein
MLRTGIHLSQAEAFEQQFTRIPPGQTPRQALSIQTLPAVNLPDVPDAQTPSESSTPAECPGRFLLPCNVPVGESLPFESLPFESCPEKTLAGRVLRPLALKRIPHDSTTILLGSH